MFDWFKKKCEHEYYVIGKAKSSDSSIYRDKLYFHEYILTCVNCGKYIEEKIIINDVPVSLKSLDAEKTYTKIIELRLYTKYKIVNKL